MAVFYYNAATGTGDYEPLTYTSATSDTYCTPTKEFIERTYHGEIPPMDETDGRWLWPGKRRRDFRSWVVRPRERSPPV